MAELLDYYLADPNGLPYFLLFLLGVWGVLLFSTSQEALHHRFGIFLSVCLFFAYIWDKRTPAQTQEEEVGCLSECSGS